MGTKYTGEIKERYEFGPALGCIKCEDGTPTGTRLLVLDLGDVTVALCEKHENQLRQWLDYNMPLIPEHGRLVHLEMQRLQHELDELRHFMFSLKR